MIKKIIMFLGVIILLNGCFHMGSSTSLVMMNTTKTEFINFEKDAINIITNLNPAFDCEYGQKELGYKKDELIACSSINAYGCIYISMEKNNAEIGYSGGDEFWIPSNEKITDEHKMIQGLFVGLAYYFKEKYKKDVQVIFYHHDLPKEGRRLF